MSFGMTLAEMRGDEGELFKVHVYALLRAIGGAIVGDQQRRKPLRDRYVVQLPRPREVPAERMEKIESSAWASKLGISLDEESPRRVESITCKADADSTTLTVVP